MINGNALLWRLDVDEVDVQPVDLGLKLRQRVQSRLAPAPVRTRSSSSARGYRRQLHTPADRSVTSSLVGQRVASMRRRELVDLALR
jgi:hypothetical protein